MFPSNVARSRHRAHIYAVHGREAVGPPRMASFGPHAVVRPCRRYQHRFHTPMAPLGSIVNTVSISRKVSDAFRSGFLPIRGDTGALKTTVDSTLGAHAADATKFSGRREASEVRGGVPRHVVTFPATRRRRVAYSRPSAATPSRSIYVGHDSTRRKGTGCPNSRSRTPRSRWPRRPSCRNVAWSGKKNTAVSWSGAEHGTRGTVPARGAGHQRTYFDCNSSRVGITSAPAMLSTPFERGTLSSKPQ